MNKHEDKPAMNGWESYQKLVLHELERLSENIEKLVDKQNKSERDIAHLKATASAWGVAGGIIVSVVGWLIDLLHKGN